MGRCYGFSQDHFYFETCHKGKHLKFNFSLFQCELCTPRRKLIWKKKMYWLQLGQLTCFIIAHISLFGLVTKTVTSWLKKAKMVCKVTTISSRFPVYLSHPQICERIYILKTCRISLCHSQKSEITTEQHVKGRYRNSVERKPV